MWIPATAALLLLGGAAASPRPAPQAQVDSVSTADLKAGFLELEDEYTDAYNAWRTAYTSVSSEYRRAYAEDPNTPRPEYPERIEASYFARFDRLAAQGQPDARLWCLTNYTLPASSPAERARDFTGRVLDVLRDSAEGHASLAQIVSRQSSGRPGSLLQPAQGSALLTLIETVSQDPNAQGAAAYMRASMPPMDGLSPEQKKSMKLSSMRSFAKRYPESSYAKRATGFVFQEENLQIGMVAPDIVGSDVDGNGMKLSDFRGKVTVIDFWGFW